MKAAARGGAPIQQATSARAETSATLPRPALSSGLSVRAHTTTIRSTDRDRGTRTVPGDAQHVAALGQITREPDHGAAQANRRHAPSVGAVLTGQAPAQPVAAGDQLHLADHLDL